MNKHNDKLTPKQEKFLRNLNIGASSVMGAWAILQIYLILEQDFIFDTSIILELPKFDKNNLDDFIKDESESFLGISRTKNKKIKSRKIKISVLLFIFSLITSISHAFQATNINKYYTNQLNKKINYQRWIEYSITSSIMYGAKLLIGRQNRFDNFVPCVLLTGLTNIFGLGIESSQNAKDKFIPEILLISGFISQLYPIIISTVKTLTFTESVKESIDFIKSLNIAESSLNFNSEQISFLKEIAKRITNDEFDTSLGSFTFLNIVRFGNVIFDVLYFIFPAILIAQRFSGKKLDTNRYYKTEAAYIFASIFVKTYLVWYLFIATFRSNRNENNRNKSINRIKNLKENLKKEIKI